MKPLGGGVVGCVIHWLLIIYIVQKWQKQMLTLYDNSSKNAIKDICCCGINLDRPEYSDADTTREKPTCILYLGI